MRLQGGKLVVKIQVRSGSGPCQVRAGPGQVWFSFNSLELDSEVGLLVNIHIYSNIHCLIWRQVLVHSVYFLYAQLDTCAWINIPLLFSILLPCWKVKSLKFQRSISECSRGGCRYEQIRIFEFLYCYIKLSLLFNVQIKVDMWQCQ